MSQALTVTDPVVGIRTQDASIPHKHQNKKPYQTKKQQVIVIYHKNYQEAENVEKKSDDLIITISNKVATLTLKT